MPGRRGNRLGLNIVRAAGPLARWRDEDPVVAHACEDVPRSTTEYSPRRRGAPTPLLNTPGIRPFNQLP